MTAQRLLQAKELDNSFNHEDHDKMFERPAIDRSFERQMPLTVERPSEQKPVARLDKIEPIGKPMLSPLIKKEPSPGLLTVIGNNELDKARREDVKKMVQ
jgi:hypothetical protein